ncbi:unnamed protein product [Haemonchus placei]|uniref:CPSF_A domain-containing protein n=1 Tax=Haemonchus placei TaxID=6290 RepID=A0A0N4W7I1_HAEPC|nr:unnamed protein product [Haemonchus placei]
MRYNRTKINNMYVYMTNSEVVCFGLWNEDNSDYGLTTYLCKAVGLMQITVVDRFEPKPNLHIMSMIASVERKMLERTILSVVIVF